MFRGFPRARLAELAGQARVSSVPRNTAPVRLGEALPGLLVVLRGMLKVALPQGGPVAVRGRDVGLQAAVGRE